MSRPPTSHWCDPDQCVCPIHGTTMFYSPREQLHACQDPACKYAHGYEIVIETEFWADRAVRRSIDRLRGEEGLPDDTAVTHGGG